MLPLLSLPLDVQRSLPLQPVGGGVQADAPPRVPQHDLFQPIQQHHGQEDFEGGGTLTSATVRHHHNREPRHYTGQCWMCVGGGGGGGGGGGCGAVEMATVWYCSYMRGAGTLEVALRASACKPRSSRSAHEGEGGDKALCTLPVRTQPSVATLPTVPYKLAKNPLGTMLFVGPRVASQGQNRHTVCRRQ